MVNPDGTDEAYFPGDALVARNTRGRNRRKAVYLGRAIRSWVRR